MKHTFHQRLQKLSQWTLTFLTSKHKSIHHQRSSNVTEAAQNISKIVKTCLSPVEVNHHSNNSWVPCDNVLHLINFWTAQQTNNIWFPQYVSLTWLAKGYSTMHRPTEDLREHKYTYPSPTTLKIRIASFSRPFFRVGNCVRVTYNTKTAKIELLQRYNNYYKGLCPCYPF